MENFMINKQYDDFYLNILGTNINKARLRICPLHSMLDCTKNFTCHLKNLKMVASYVLFLSLLHRFWQADRGCLFLQTPVCYIWWNNPVPELVVIFSGISFSNIPRYFPEFAIYLIYIRGLELHSFSRNSIVKHGTCCFPSQKICNSPILTQNWFVGI